MWQTKWTVQLHIHIESSYWSIFDVIHGMTANLGKDPLIVKEWPMTRSQVKRIREAMWLLAQATIDGTFIMETKKHDLCPEKKHKWINLVQTTDNKDEMGPMQLHRARLHATACNQAENPTEEFYTTTSNIIMRSHSSNCAWNFPKFVKSPKLVKTMYFGIFYSPLNLISFYLVYEIF